MNAAGMLTQMKAMMSHVSTCITDSFKDGKQIQFISFSTLSKDKQGFFPLFQIMLVAFPGENIFTNI